MSTESATRIRILGRPAAVAAGVAAPLVVWVVAVPGAGIDLAARTGETVTRIGPLSVASAALVAGLAGWGLLAALERHTKKPRTTWTVVAGAALLVSVLLGPLGGVSISAGVVLIGMHLVVGAVLIALLPRAGARH